MNNSSLINALMTYETSLFVTPEELPKIETIIQFIQSNPRCLERDNQGHITASAWVIQKDRVLLTHHKKLNIWLQLGGHTEGSSDLPTVALREAHEESGIDQLKILHTEIFDVDIHPIPGTCFKHYDIRYLIGAPENASYTVSRESHDLAWVEFSKIPNYSQERSVLRMAEKMIRARTLRW